jgi:hypothetical protein
MSEIDNKIRLNQARRNAVKKRASNADENSSKKGLYGGKNESEEAKGRMNPFKGVTNPVAAAKKAKNIVTAPMEMQATDVAIYGIAFSLAALKDLLDLAFIGSFPAIGTVITFCVSIAIGFVLLFDGISSSQRKIARRMTRRYLVLIAGTISEAFLFGLNFFPFEIATVAIIYWMSLADRKGK